MADNFKPLQAGTFSLAGSGCVIGATSIILKSMTDIDGTLITMSMLGDIAYMTLEPGNGALEEQISFAGISQNANGTATLTTVKHVLFESPYTQSAGVTKTHAGSTTAVLSNTSGFYNELTSRDNDETVTGLWDFPSGANNPTIGDVTYVAPTGQTQIATKGYVDSVALGTTTTDQIVVAGTGGETITVGQAVYLKISDQRWWKADASATSSSVGVQLGFAETASTAGTSISVLISGLEKNLTGLSAGSNYFLTDTPGTISTTAGTNRVFVGNATSTTRLLAEFESSQQQFAGDSGVPSSANTFVTQKGLQVSAEIYAASSAGTDTYAITLSPVPTAYVNGMTVRFKADVANTGAATLNVNTLGAITIKKNHDQDLATGDIEANQIVEVIYNSTGPVFEMSSQSAISPSTDVQVFQTAGADTWTKPAGAKFVEVHLFGGGGGGGGGGRNANGDLAYGGAGGGGGGYTYKRLSAAALGSTVGLVVGAGGAGGAVKSVDGNGNDGSNGVASSFGTNFLIANPGGLGGGGVVTPAAGGVGGVITNGDITIVGGAGGNGGVDNGVQGVDSTNVISPRGGGGAGDGNSGTSGAGGGFITYYVQAGGAAGVNVTNNGSDGATTDDDLIIGGVGGGGGRGTANNGSGSGGNGGAGGFPGGGGGGGGGCDSTSGTNGGAGGAGAKGMVIVVTYL